MSAVAVERVCKQNQPQDRCNRTPTNVLVANPNITPQQYYNDLANFFRAVNSQPAELEKYKTNLYRYTVYHLNKYHARTGSKTFEYPFAIFKNRIHGKHARIISVILQRAQQILIKKGEAKQRIRVVFSFSEKDVDRIQSILNDEFNPAWLIRCPDVKADYDKRKSELYSQLYTERFVISLV